MNKRRSILTAFVLLAGFGLVAFAQQSAWKTPPVMAHAAEGRDNCLMCHKAGAMEAVPDAPANHADRPNTTCLQCHAKDAAVQTVAPAAMSHTAEGRDNCMMCHKAGAMEPVPDAPADHEGRDNKYCTLCHIPAA